MGNPPPTAQLIHAHVHAEDKPNDTATDSLCRTEGAKKMSASCERSDAPPDAHDGEIEFDPPLGKMPPFTFMHPVLHGASERWKSGGGSKRLMEILKSSDVNMRSMRTLIKFTMLMGMVPMLTMFLCYKFVLELFFTFEYASDKMLYAGIAAIGSVQLVIVSFLITAFTEPDDASETKKSA